jgi:hypothetical protein
LKEAAGAAAAYGARRAEGMAYESPGRWYLDGIVDGKAAHLTDWSGTSRLPTRSFDAF